jgi:hypothetical protein
MITSTSKTLQDYFASSDFNHITNATSLMAVILLVAVVVEREIVRMSSPDTARRNVTVFGIIAAPVFVVFGAIIILRFIRLS